MFDVLRYMGYRPDVDFWIERQRLTDVLVWINGSVPRPTDEQIAAAAGSQEFATWLAENGGDPLLTRRKRAMAMLNSPDPAMVALRALARVVQARMSALLTALGRTPITTTQLVSLWADEIANGNVDDGLPE